MKNLTIKGLPKTASEQDAEAQNTTTSTPGTGPTMESATTTTNAAAETTTAQPETTPATNTTVLAGTDASGNVEITFPGETTTTTGVSNDALSTLPPDIQQKIIEAWNKAQELRLMDPFDRQHVDTLINTGITIVDGRGVVLRVKMKNNESAYDNNAGFYDGVTPSRCISMLQQAECGNNAKLILTNGKQGDAFKSVDVLELYNVEGTPYTETSGEETLNWDQISAIAGELGVPPDQIKAQLDIYYQFGSSMKGNVELSSVPVDTPNTTTTFPGETTTTGPEETTTTSPEETTTTSVTSTTRLPHVGGGYFASPDFAVESMGLIVVGAAMTKFIRRRVRTTQ